MIHHDLQNKNEVSRATFDVGSNGLTVYQHFENGLFQRIVFDLSRTPKKIPFISEQFDAAASKFALVGDVKCRPVHCINFWVSSSDKQNRCQNVCCTRCHTGCHIVNIASGGLRSANGRDYQHIPKWKRNRTNAFKCIFLVCKTCLSIFDYKFEQLRPLEVSRKPFSQSSMIKFEIAQNGIILQFFIDNANS